MEHISKYIKIREKRFMASFSHTIPPGLHPLPWFTGRIGKKIYRDTVDCKCSGCTDGTENGILVHDKDHAEYLYNVQLDMDIRYRARK